MATCDEPTGSAVPMYSVTTASRMAARRAFELVRRRRRVGWRRSESACGVMACLALKSTECQRLLTGRAAPGSGRPPGAGLLASVVTQAQRGDEGLLGHLDAPDVLHPLLALLLLLEQLALAGDVAAVALGQDVLALGLDRLAGDDAPADGGLDRARRTSGAGSARAASRPSRRP